MNEETQQLINKGILALKKADSPEKASNILAELSARLIVDDGDEIPDISKQVEAAIDELDDLIKHKGRKNRISTGLAGVDKNVMILPGDLVVIAAESSRGKTALAFNILEHAAIVNRKPVLAFSLEMASNQLIFRMMASRARVDIRNATETDDKAAMKKLVESATKIRHAPIFLEDNPDITDLGVRTKTRRMVQSHGIQIAIVDYLQLLSMESGKDRTETQMLSEKTMSLKRMALELNIAVIVLSQVEEISGKLYGSRAIQHHADTVLKILPPAAGEGPHYLYIVKQRSGPRDRSIPLTFHQTYTRFDDYVSDI